MLKRAPMSSARISGCDETHLLGHGFDFCLPVPAAVKAPVVADEAAAAMLVRSDCDRVMVWSVNAAAALGCADEGTIPSIASSADSAGLRNARHEC